MTVIAMDSAPESVRGELTRWFLELKPGVFVGRVNSRIRDLLWKRICETDSAAGAVMVFSAPNEQGFEMKVSGDPKRRVIDFEGIQLITVSEEAHRNTEAEECFEFPFELQLLEEEVLASGDNRHSGSGEKRQFWSTENSHLQFE